MQTYADQTNDELSMMHLQDVLQNAPALMLPSERWMLYALVRGIRPQYILEIGSNRGGSALIMATALQHNGSGYITMIDKVPNVDADIWQKIDPLARLIAADSRIALPDLRKENAHFDFVLIDGDHTQEGAAKDLKDVLKILDSRAHILVHDAHNRDVRQGIDAVLFEYRHDDRLRDGGILTADYVCDEKDLAIRWAGLRLLYWHAY